MAGWCRVQGEGGLRWEVGGGGGGRSRGEEFNSKPASGIFITQRWETAGEGRSHPELLQGREGLQATFVLPSITLSVHV